MLPLGTIKPHRILIFDHHRIRRHLTTSPITSSTNPHEARVHPRDIRVQRNRLAGAVEGGLRDGVVASHELELDGVAWRSGEFGGGEGEGGVVADCYEVGFYGCLGVGGGGEGEEGEDEICEVHFGECGWLSGWASGLVRMRIGGIKDRPPSSGFVVFRLAVVVVVWVK